MCFWEAQRANISFSTRDGSKRTLWPRHWSHEGIREYSEDDAMLYGFRNYCRFEPGQLS